MHASDKRGAGKWPAPRPTLCCQLVMTDSDLRCGLHSEGRDDLEDADDD